MGRSAFSLVQFCTSIYSTVKEIFFALGAVSSRGFINKFMIRARKFREYGGGLERLSSSTHHTQGRMHTAEVELTNFP